MKIDKVTAFKILAKHLVKKLGANNNQIDLNTIATSISIMFMPQIPALTKLGIIEDNNFNIEVLEQKITQVFTYAPTLNFPIGTSSIQITKKDVLDFIKDLKENSFVEDVIYLSNK